MKYSIIIVIMIAILYTNTFVSSMASRERDIKIQKTLDRIEYQLDSNMIVPYDVWMVAINRTNAMWNGLVVSDSALRMYLGNPPGSWIDQYKSDSLLKEFQEHMKKFHALRKYPGATINKQRRERIKNGIKNTGEVID